MSQNHKHRTVYTTRDSLLYKFVTIRLVWTRSQKRADASRFQYRETKGGYELRILGVLHTLCGLELDFGNRTDV